MRTYGSIVPEAQAATLSSSSKRGDPTEAQVFKRRTAIAAALLAVLSLLMYVVVKLNPESSREQSKDADRVDILEHTFDALQHFWPSSKHDRESFADPTDASVMLSSYCCDESICSKYALAACKSRRDKERKEDRESQEIESYLDDADSSSSSSADLGHPGASNAASAMGLQYAGSQGSSRSYYGMQRDRAMKALAAKEGSDAPAPTVGLIKRGSSRHEGALKAAEAFGLHLVNVPGGSGSRKAHPVAMSAHRQRTQILLQEGTGGGGAPIGLRRADSVFFAPINFASNAISKVWSSVQRSGGGQSEAGMLHASSYPTTVSGYYHPLSGMVTDIQGRGTTDGKTLETSPFLDVAGQQVTPLGTRTYNVGSIFPSPATAPPPPEDSGYGVYSAPNGWEDGSAQGIMSIRVGTPCGLFDSYPCEQKPKVHLTVEVFCPPYKAPTHGSVWYNGTRYWTVTSKEKEHKTWKMGGQEVPIAQDGDIPAGEEVRIECDIHYRPSVRGSRTPRCLDSGSWEEGKVCEPIMCDAYVAPLHGVAVPSQPVMAGEQVEIICDEGYDEYYGDEEEDDLAPVSQLSKQDPWWDFSSWFAGPNQGKKGNLISMEAGPQTAAQAVLALNGYVKKSSGRQLGRSISKSLHEVDKKLKKLKREKEALKHRDLLSKEITKMSRLDVDRMVEAFVRGGAAPARPIVALSKGEAASSSLVAEKRTGGRSSRQLLSVKPERFKKFPVCLDTGKFQQGILCKSKPRPVIRAPPGPKGEERFFGGRIAPPRGTYIVPLICPSYIAPDHGSVWYKGQEYKIATASGIHATEKVKITCHQHFKPSRIGSDEPQCLMNGQWEVGKTCEPIYCTDYGDVKNGMVSTHDYVRAGTRVQITCHRWYQPAGLESGARVDPMCLDSGEFEKGVICVPKPCPVDSHNCPQQGVVTSEGIQPHVSKQQEKDYEQQLQVPMQHDYSPNVFDQEPRPYSLDIPLDAQDTLLRPVDSRRVRWRDTTRSWTKWDEAPNSWDDSAGQWYSDERSPGAGAGQYVDEGDRH
uniref:Sushi domain-containing protein n=1 Tax=Hanusia phi TaxID=3032 RepID=A0A7S0HCB7_9CRYP|mmetsp:Transcript_12682/g.29189  ORF Transcript_12682/g.29189 Transcript_12682/m.29189 type:complete len:1032 (+) Transcript_12682:306-3401(+)